MNTTTPRPTPEVDAEAARTLLYDSGGEETEAVEADFARTLERQKDELAEVVQGVLRDNNDAGGELLTAERHEQITKALANLKPTTPCKS